MLGGYTVHDTITAEDMDLFNNVMNGLDGVKYEPVIVATQIVNGTNYCFICKSTTITQTLPEGISKVIIYKPLSKDPILSSIEKII